MKVSKLFHWLYFIVMMLPIFTIPIFAIYSHRHTIDSYSVTRVEPLQVNAYQYIENGKPYNTSNVELLAGDSVSIKNGCLSVFVNYPSDIDAEYNFYNNLSLVSSHIYYFSFSVQYDNLDHTYFDGDPIVSFIDDDARYDDFIEYYQINLVDEFDSSFTTFYKNYTCSTTGVVDGFYFGSDDELMFSGDFNIKSIMFFDLTNIFGSGNEPTADVFKSYLVNDYYEFGNNILNIGTHNVTYNDTDIGSQFTYDVYNVIDKYFNYDRVFNFGDLYSWLNTTFFNSHAPLGFFIFWHLLVYWLLTSILWLIFDILMYVPQLVHRWLDKASLS